MMQIGFSASDAVSGLKLIERVYSSSYLCSSEFLHLNQHFSFIYFVQGVPKAQLALLAVPLVPLQIVLPLVISRYTSGPRPMQTFLAAIPFRLLPYLILKSKRAVKYFHQRHSIYVKPLNV